VAEEKKQRAALRKALKEKKKKEKEEKKRKREENAKKREARLARDLNDNNMIDPAAKKWWEKNIGEHKDIVTNAEFAVPLKEYLKTKTYKFDVNPKRLLFDERDEEKRNKEIDDFIKIVLERFFLLPDPSQYKDKTPPQNFVSKDAVQCCIHVFGPWNQIFEMIKRIFFEIEVPYHVKVPEPEPLEVWHDRLEQAEAEELLIQGDEKKSSRKAVSSSFWGC